MEVSLCSTIRWLHFVTVADWPVSQPTVELTHAMLYCIFSGSNMAAVRQRVRWSELRRAVRVFPPREVKAK